MASKSEASMSALKRFWTGIVRLAQALEGIDDPGGQYMAVLERRIDKLERDLRHIERRVCESERELHEALTATSGTAMRSRSGL
jgi:hypothetical protein